MEVDPQPVSYSWLNSMLELLEVPLHSSSSLLPESCKVFWPMDIDSQGKDIVSCEGDGCQQKGDVKRISYHSFSKEGEGKDVSDKGKGTWVRKLKLKSMALSYANAKLSIGKKMGQDLKLTAHEDFSSSTSDTSGSEISRPIAEDISLSHGFAALKEIAGLIVDLTMERDPREEKRRLKTHKI
ncbi:hypothetical protein QYF36_003019 [Acer negundo]|nr:hypothetical protein QYF36_003019 [Acer negundo]